MFVGDECDSSENLVFFQCGRQFSYILLYGLKTNSGLDDDIRESNDLSLTYYRASRRFAIHLNEKSDRDVFCQ